ncbi:chromosome partitioning protein ParA [Marinithermofilum abyssi]|uniref:Chromosome partitioning protein ParA n=1 Tax=Marinithermofilum abyssi TaxID=1571185 RepID=A0A8J2VG54_9BACL|nr:ParA family protein [Marinithermofilum abyssi]GGE30049.1 chromosome partitioning protein ParA [Marinithermofilum abyssi]
MTTVITFGQQKGGAAKTTSAAVTAYLLSMDQKVLLVDFDPQGNATELITQMPTKEFEGKSVMEAIRKGEAADFVYNVMENFWLLPATDDLSEFASYIYDEAQIPKGKRAKVLQKTLASIMNRFDYIIIDTPPSLGELTVNALATSDYVVVMFEPSKFCYSAIERFLVDTLDIKERANSSLEVAGILPVLLDFRRGDIKDYLELIEEEYPGLMFDTKIKRKAATARLSISGFLNNPELTQAAEPYDLFVEELLERTKRGVGISG